VKLFYSPNACSMAIHVLLEEIGKPYELRRVDFSKKEQLGAEFSAISPKAKVPVLERDDGSHLTELPAIAWYLARSNPELNLLPADIEGEARLLEIMDYLIATVHMRGFTRIFRPENFSPTPEDKEKVQETGRQTVAQGFEIIAPVLGTKDYLLGAFSIADAALFFLEYWAVRRAGMTLPAALDGHLQRMLARPAVQRALAAEGLS
jgi:glutathione S-transferase